MEWPNYQHLLYFWTAARLGSVTRAAEELHLTQPTLSAQIRALERRMGQPLFAKAGRRLVPTEAGQVAFRYAEEIFGLGRELVETLRGRPTGQPLRMRVGVVDAVPKLVAYRLLRPALAFPEGVRLTCVEGKREALVADLALHRLDAVLSDQSVPEGASVRVFAHSLGESGVTVFGKAALARRCRPGFPRSLGGAPLLLPLAGTSVHEALQAFFEREGIAPRVVGEFEDGALLKAFGYAGLGLFPGPTAIEREIRAQYGVEVAGRLPGVRERFYVLSAERRLKHPGVVAISSGARERLFAAG